MASILFADRQKLFVIFARQTQRRSAERFFGNSLENPPRPLRGGFRLRALIHRVVSPHDLNVRFDGGERLGVTRGDVVVQLHRRGVLV
jgi:hypothetical protein